MTQSEQLEYLRCAPEDAIEDIIRSYASLSRRTVLSVTGRAAGAEDVEEIVSDVFLQVYNNRMHIDLAKGSLALYIVTLSRRRAVDFLRRRGKAPVEIPLQDAAEEACESDGPYASYEAKAVRTALADAVRALPEPDRTIIFRRFCYNESYREIGNKLDMRENAVNKRCLKALKKLRKILEGVI
ncbi:MAG: sigma-70 family RNA polymerase sigma factor [Clostridia bacterium]|nr:sigma-70 family RNA polymerase sigma factor [Clostridia bacterium]